MVCVLNKKKKRQKEKETSMAKLFITYTSLSGPFKNKKKEINHFFVIHDNS